MSLLRDFKHAARRLARDWRFTLAAAFTLSLGIGANATVFTIVDTIMLRELPFTDHDRVVSVGSRHANGRQMGVSFRDFEDWRDNAKTMSGMAMWGNYTLNVSDPGRDPERYNGIYVSGNIFKLMGQKPAIGRDFLPEDDKPGAPPVMIISHTVWQNRYGSDPSLLGKVVKVSEIPATVIGVMPVAMRFPPNTDLWLPIQLMPAGVRNVNRNARNYGSLARLADGVTLERARAELTSLGQGLQKTYADTNKDVLPMVVTYAERMRGGDNALVSRLLLGAVTFVLLIACANVANLLLARSANRTREVAVRLAIGSSRWRIIRELLVESILLSFLGGAIGIWLGYAGLKLFLASMDQNWPFWMTFAMDARVIAFLAGICLLTAVALRPHAGNARLAHRHELRAEGRRRPQRVGRRQDAALGERAHHGGTGAHARPPLRRWLADAQLPGDVQHRRWLQDRQPAGDVAVAVESQVSDPRIAGCPVRATGRALRRDSRCGRGHGVEPHAVRGLGFIALDRRWSRRIG